MNWKWIIAITLAAAPALSWSNMRAPIHMDFGGRSALRPSVKDNRIVVRGETLGFDCRLSASGFGGGRCQVDADYRIESKKATWVALQFLVPKTLDIFSGIEYEQQKPVVNKITVNGRQLTYHLSETTSENTHGRGHARVDFNAQLKANNQVQVVYQQNLSVDEVSGPSYFLASEFINYIDYALWPLKEWHKAADFSLSVHIKSNTRKRGLLFWRRTLVRCYGCQYDQSRDKRFQCVGIKQHSSRQAGFMTVKFHFGQIFPDYLHCEIGGSNILGTDAIK